MLDAPQPLVPRGAAYYPVPNGAPTRHYAFLLLSDFTLLAFSAAIDAFRIANQLSQKPLYRWTVLSEDGAPVRSSCGVSIGVDGGLTPLSRETTLFVCSGNLNGRQASSSTLAFVNRHHRFGGAVGGLCTGAVTLARAGLLVGRAFTLHWENQPGFSELFPDLLPTPRKFEIDGRVLTCGGGAAATDLALAIIAQDHGREFATIVSDMCLRRADVGPDQSQRTSLGAVLHTRNPRLISIVRLMVENFEAPLSMEDLAGEAGYTRRHLERLFQLCLGESPGQFYRNLRLDHARSLLTDTDMTLFEIAAACGFESKAYFAKAFKQRFGCPPSKLNYHFQRCDRA
ncbi:GlxA family transcriptional regulator [Defluviimonas sp. WL0024]|uniref:GlxA family transcriptional regulator n=1 Tax=Albidovulum salinarum TaxID=2984153 RepID=A0ABT2X4X4_9RHOB|nr:GlxA family transcriptional regulator [Defluviimonas sp. WL0024]MCU9848987.1 GlxA family transcriptional regulator [Defluviimonas sp. WL0024]